MYQNLNLCFFVVVVGGWWLSSIFLSAHHAVTFNVGLANPMLLFLLWANLLGHCAGFIPFLAATTASSEHIMAASSSSSCKMAVFSDVDGTLVHYPKNLAAAEPEGNAATESIDLLYLPPSKTGQRGVISSKTLRLCQKLRHRGMPFVLVSGMRSTTLFQRLPYLPRADAYVSESGGRIFFPVDSPLDDEHQIDGLVDGLLVNPEPYTGCPSSHHNPFTLVEDMEWRNQISNLQCAGSDGYSTLAPRAGSDGFSTLTPPTPIEHRRGTLWEHAKTLQKQGFFLDSSGYATAFRINRKHQEDDLALNFDNFLQKCKDREGIPDELGCSTNLGCVDFYPIMSGKRNVCDYLLRKFFGDHDEAMSLKSHALCLCDDDNDVEMALACRKAYIPSITSESMQKLASENRDMIVTENVEEGKVESLATEAALEMILYDN